MKYVKSAITLSIFICMLCFLPSLVQAQPGPGGDPDVPIDGGISILAAAGIGYGAKKLKEYKRKKFSDNDQSV